MATNQTISVSGGPYERGKAIGQALAHSIRLIIDVQQEADYVAGDPTRPLLNDWLPQAEKYLPFIKKYAPRTLLEMQGMAEGAQCDFGAILLLTCAYEKHMGSGTAANHCTAFAAWKEATEDGRLLCGQNNDETPEAWLKAEHDVVIHHHDSSSGQQTLIYTHPGIPAYMGMNSDGLCLTWMYIDNGQRAIAGPTNAIIREVLYQPTLSGALDYIKTIPHAVPNTFLLAHPIEGLSCVEVSPNCFYASSGEMACTHGNTITQQALMNGKALPETCVRQQRMMTILMDQAVGLNVESAQAMLTDNASDPSIHNAKTLARMIFDPTEGNMYITIGTYDKVIWRCLSFS